MRVSVTPQPALYLLGWSTASTHRPALDGVARIGAREKSPVRRGPPQAGAQEFVDVNGDGLEAPGPTSLLELADQLLFLAVDADDRLSGRLERGDLLVDVGELDVPVGVIRASFELLAVDVQRI